MTWRSLIFAFGVVVIGSSCAPPAPAPPAAPTLTPPGRVAALTTGCEKFAKRIKGLKPGFDPAKYTICDNPGDATCTKDPPEDDNIPRSVSGQDPSQDIIGACNIAPAFFQAELAKLHRVYINTDTDPSKPLVWGLRQRNIPDPDDKKAKKKTDRHITAAVERTVIDPLPNQPYASYETWVLNALL